MAEMITEKHDRWHPEFFVSECRSFVESARTKPVPADWLQAGMEPAHGVSMEPTFLEIEMPAYPEPPKPILGMHTAGSVKQYWDEVGHWCRD